MLIDWSSFLTGAAGAGNSMLFGAPETIARKISGDQAVDQFINKNKNAYEGGRVLGDVASAAIPFGAIGKVGKEVKALAFADKTLDAGKGAEALRAAKILEPAEDVAKVIQKSDRAKKIESIMQEIKKESESTPLVSDVITKQKAQKILEGEQGIPEGWFVHGRKGRQDIDTNFVKQMTRNIDVANGYAGEGGSVWLIKPNAKTKIADFTHPESKDMDEFIKNIKSRFNSPEELLDKYNLKGAMDPDWDSIESYLRNDFTPSNIVSSAQAFDDADITNILENYPGGFPDFVKTPDGAILMPGSEGKIDKINLTGKIGRQKPVSKIADKYTKKLQQNAPGWVKITAPDGRFATMKESTPESEILDFVNSNKVYTDWMKGKI
jgi:hypothetical protein